MTFRDKVLKILADTLEDDEKKMLCKAVEEKVGASLTRNLTRDFQEKFSKYLHLKGEEFIKPLIRDTCQEMIVLNTFKDNEAILRRVVQEELDKVRAEIKKEMGES